VEKLTAGNKLICNWCGEIQSVVLMIKEKCKVRLESKLNSTEDHNSCPKPPQKYQHQFFDILHYGLTTPPLNHFWFLEGFMLVLRRCARCCQFSIERQSSIRSQSSIHRQPILNSHSQFVVISQFIVISQIIVEFMFS